VLEVGLLLGLESETLLLETHISAVPIASERVAVIDQTFSGVEIDITATDQIGRSKKLFLFEGHSGVVGVDRHFG